jgi:mono/diheme cytochrome c family protein
MRGRQFVIAAASFVFFGTAGAAGQKPKGPDDLVVKGKGIYQKYCAACHGAKGEGKPGWEERDALGELAPPPHDPTGHTWKHSDAMLYRMVRDGWRDPFNKTKRLTMPAYKDVLSPTEIKAVITYLKTVWTPEQREYQREESKGHPFPPEAH